MRLLRFLYNFSVLNRALVMTTWRNIWHSRSWFITKVLASLFVPLFAPLALLLAPYWQDPPDPDKGADV